jgi:dsRNA-specific ribonuclease
MALNRIQLDEGLETTAEIAGIMELSRRILLVVEEKDKSCYMDSDELARDRPYYECLKTGVGDKMITTFSKFYYLAMQGYIRKEMFDLVVVRASSIRKEFASSFKHFYMGEDGGHRPQVLAYLRAVGRMDSLVLQSSRPCPSLPGRVKQIIFTPEYLPEIEEYIRLRILLQCELSGRPELEEALGDIRLIEDISFTEAAKHIRSVLSLKRMKTVCFSERLTSVQLERILVSEHKFRRLRELASKGMVFLLTSKKNLIGLLKAGRVFDAKEVSTSFIEENCSNASLICYDRDGLRAGMEIASLPFKEMVVMQCPGEFCTNFIDLALARGEPGDEGGREPDGEMSNGEGEHRRSGGKLGGSLGLSDLSAFFEYSKPLHGSYVVPSTRAMLSTESSVQLLRHFLYLVEKLFEENLLCLRNIEMEHKYQVDSRRMYSCILRLPQIHDHELFTSEHRSGVFMSKRLALADVSKAVMKKIHFARLCDDHLFPDMKAFITDNRVYHSFVRSAYGVSDTSPENLRRLCREFAAESGEKGHTATDFLRGNRVYINGRCDVRSEEIDSVYRAQPQCLKSYPKVYSAYVFNGGKEGLGLLVGESFEEPVSFKGVAVDFIGRCELTEAQLESIVFYQIIFFSVSFRRVNAVADNSRKYCYLVVPIADMSIDFGLLGELSSSFIRSSVYENRDHSLLETNLLLDPFTCTFYTYNSSLDKSINSVISEAHKAKETYASYFERKYGITLVHKTDEMGLMFRGCIASGKGSRSPPSVLSSEVIHVTSVKRGMVEQLELLQRFLYAFESIALAHEFSKSLKLSISLSGVCIALSTKNELLTGAGYADYERMEFLGDSVLKFTATRQLFLCSGSEVGAIALTKDSIIQNSNLMRQADRINIRRYFSLQRYTKNLFQPPDVTLLNMSKDAGLRIAEYIAHFGSEKIFKNNNQHVFAMNRASKAVGGLAGEAEAKTYADIIEALIGVHYLELGLEAAAEFIMGLGLVEKGSGEQEDVAYGSVVGIEELRRIEEIIGYTFRNAGWLERAITHPSYSNNVFGTQTFQKLELMGDCTMDICVTRHIYLEYPQLDSSGLHDVRKSLVNNYTFARVLHRTGLMSLCRTGFSDEVLESAHNNLENDLGKVSKVFSDLFEAIAGAVIADCDLDLGRFNVFFTKILSSVLDCRYKC